MMKYKIGDVFYLKGTKQKFRILDCFSFFNMAYLLVSEKYRHPYSIEKYSFEISEHDLIEKYKLI